MTDGSITTSGAKSISLYSSGVNSKTEIKNGKIRAEGGALGLLQITMQLFNLEIVQMLIKSCFRS